MFCEKCGVKLREGAKFCPECGVTAEDALPPPDAEYSYETLQKLFTRGAKIFCWVMFLFFFGLGLAVASGTGFWGVPLVMGGIPLFAILVVMWANKGQQKKWGVDRTLWIITSEGYGTGYPLEVAKRVGGIGVAGAVSGQNLAISLTGINMAAGNIKRVIKGIPIMPWTAFISAEYRPEKREIALHMPDGQVGLIHTNSDNYAYVEQLVRLYMGGKQ